MRRPGAETKVGGSPATMMGPPAAWHEDEEKENRPQPATLCCLVPETGAEKPGVVAASSMRARTAMSQLAPATQTARLQAGPLDWRR